jgi:hypothetical protein
MTPKSHSSRRSKRSSGPYFLQFNRLPKELREMIWEAALPDPRVVYVTQESIETYFCTRVWSDKAIDETFNSPKKVPTFFDLHEDEDALEKLLYYSNSGEGFGPDWRRGLRSRCPPPNLLFVCRESYEVMTRHFEKAFGGYNVFPDTWFDFERDILYLDWDIYDEPLMKPGDFLSLNACKVRNLATFDDVFDDHHYDDYESWLCEILNVFTNVKQLTTVLYQLHDGTDCSELVIKTPRTDLPAIIFDYKHQVNRGPSKYPMYGGNLRPFYRDNLSEKPNIDVQKLEPYRAASDSGLLNKLPALDFQIIATPDKNAHLEYWEEIYAEAASIGSKGHMDLDGHLLTWREAQD